MTDPKNPFAPLPPFGAGVTPTFLSVLREAATIDSALKWREHFNRPLSKVDPNELEDSIEGARLAEIERDEIARLNARSKWEATQVTKTPRHLLATPAQLIAAFGTFTDMSADWFNHVDSTPGLLAARVHKGQGGRNYREPLYNVMSVLNWLISPKRR